MISRIKKWMDEQLYPNNLGTLFFLCKLSISYQLCCCLTEVSIHTLYKLLLYPSTEISFTSTSISALKFLDHCV